MSFIFLELEVHDNYLNLHINNTNTPSSAKYRITDPLQEELMHVLNSGVVKSKGSILNLLIKEPG